MLHVHRRIDRVILIGIWTDINAPRKKCIVAVIIIVIQVNSLSYSEQVKL